MGYNDPFLLVVPLTACCSSTAGKRFFELLVRCEVTSCVEALAVSSVGVLSVSAALGQLSVEAVDAIKRCSCYRICCG